MLKNKIFRASLILSVLFLSSMFAMGQNVSGPTSVTVGQSYQYTFNNGILYPTVNWLPGSGTVLTKWSSGLTHTAIISWTTPPTGSISVMNSGYTTQLGSLGGIAIASPPVPNTTFTITQNCEATSILRNTNPGSQYDWYWQTDPNGTSTTLGFAQTINRTTSGNLYLRTRTKNTPYVWSSTSQSVGAITVVSSPPSPGAISGDALIAAGTTPAQIANQTSASGTFVYGWENSTNGTVWNLISGATSATYSPGILNSKTYYRRKATNVCGTALSNTVTIDVYAIPVITSTNSRVIMGPVTMDAGAGYSAYDWKNSLNASVGSSRYLVTSTPDTYTVTITATSGGISVNAPSAPFQLLSQFDGQNMNYIISNTILADGVTSEDEIENLDVNKRSQTIQYFDGLGRSIQSVNTQGSPDKSDIVQPLVYDAFGREHRKYLPIVPGATDGWHETITYDAITGNYTGVAANFYGNNPTAKIAQDTRPFSETIFESSPLNRPLKGYGPGQQWSPSGSNKFIEQQYLTNVHGPGASPTAEKVIAWQINSSQVPVRSSAVTGYIETGGYFSSAQLHINTTVDEHGNQVRQYSNKQGQVVLKKVQASTSGTSNLNSVDYWALTYYLYDDFGNLRYVFPPELSKKIHQGDATGDNPNPDDLTNWAFQYKYDGRNRMVEKQVPGAGAVYMVYDDRDRLVLTQDAIQRSNRWTFTKYDALNRPVLTGIYFNTSTLGNMQLAVNNYYANLTASQAWYETYTGSGVHGYNNFSFPQVTNQHDYLTVTYYDNYTFRSQWNGSYSYFDEDLSESVNGLEYNQPANENLSVVGQITGFKIKVLDGGITGGYTWLKSVNYYDEKYRMIQALSDNYKGGVDRVTNVYDFVGKVLKTKSTHTDLTWKDRIGTSLTGNKLVRTASGNNWTGSGAASVQQLAPGQDGWLEVTVSETNTNRMIGLADTNPDLNYTSIDYAFYLNSTSLKIYENGSLKSTVAGTLISGDVVRIERTGTVMKYYKNNALVYTSATASSTLLFVDVSINTTGSTLTNVRTSFNTTAHSIIRRFEYDHGGRLLKTWHELDGAQPEILLAMNEYNELGQLVDKKLHSTVASGADAKQSVDYRYNIRGWLTKVNESDLSINESGDPRDFFGMELAYESDLGTGNPTTNLQYNGNINAIKWSTNLGLDNHDESAYNFTYDALNRLQHANHRTNTGTWTAGNYNENNLTYDLNGNIQTLQRTGDDGVQIDNLTYNYGSGSTFSNKLLFVTDGTANATDKIKGFVDGSTTGNDYSYDLNGNMLTDKNKNITANITYNFLNLPEKVTRNNSSVTYIYDATGRKLSLVADYASAQKQTDYAGEYVYENDVLQFISHEEGRILLQETETVFAADGSNVTPFTASANFTNTAQTINGETYIKVTPNVGITLSKLGATPIGGNITVAAGERYIYRVKGFSNSSKVTNLYVKGNSSDIIWFGANLPTNSTAEMWVENSFTIPAGVTQITLGVLYSVAGPSVSTDYFYINEVELVKLTTTTPEYQYNLKDHLGNVRSTFTTQPKKDTLTATLEVSSASEEQAMFNPSYDNATIASTAVYNHTAGGTRSLRLSAANANEMVGLAKSLSVVPGDTIDVEVFAKYFTPTTNNTNVSGLLATAITGAFGVTSSSTGEALEAFESLDYMFGAGSMIGPEEWEDEEAPKAYLNYILFDKDFIPYDFGFDQIDISALETGSGVPHNRLAVQAKVTKPGYVYIYLSNENDKIVDVFFDDLKIVHNQSPVIQSDGYYPFGLSFNEYLRENSVPNQYKYNEKELQDELNLGWYDYIARHYDPALGRFTSIDPAADLMRRHSPYNYAFDNPIRFVDYDGMVPTDTVKNPNQTAQVVVAPPPTIFPVPPGTRIGSGSSCLLCSLQETLIGIPGSHSEKKEEKKTENEAKNEEVEKPVATDTEDENVVYRGGPFTDKNFTPRPGVDDIDNNPRSGLSTNRSHEAATQGRGGKSQVLDLEKLKSFGFTVVESNDGHVSIRPPSNETLKNWAASRPGLDSGNPSHVLTRMVQMSVVRQHYTPPKK